MLIAVIDQGFYPDPVITFAGHRTGRRNIDPEMVSRLREAVYRIAFTIHEAKYGGQFAAEFVPAVNVQ